MTDAQLSQLMEKMTGAQKHGRLKVCLEGPYCLGEQKFRQILQHISAFWGYTNLLK